MNVYLEVSPKTEDKSSYKINETNKVLGSAGYTLSTSKDFDLILRYFIMNKDYNFQKINEQLYIMTENDLT